MKRIKTIVETKKQPAADWHALSAEEALRQLATPPAKGLAAAEAARRLDLYGRNEIASAPGPTFLQLLLAQFNNFIIMLLIGAAAISGLLGEWIDAAAILAIVVLNATLGVIQERRAEEALAALKKLAAPEAQVLRDGSRQHRPRPGAGPRRHRLHRSRQLRPRRPAPAGGGQPAPGRGRPDRRIGAGAEGRRPAAWKPTCRWATARTRPSWARWSTRAAASGVVVSTGMHTQIGLIAAMLQSVEEEVTPLQKRLDGLGKVLGVAAMAVCALVFVIGLLRGHAPLEMFMLAVGLAIAAVPEGLPAVVTISLALGMREMVKRHALIRRLSSVETLGSTTVICSDKTGTLTQNKMTVTRLWADGHFLDVTRHGRLAGRRIPGRRAAGEAARTTPPC